MLARSKPRVARDRLPVHCRLRQTNVVTLAQAGSAAAGGSAGTGTGVGAAGGAAGTATAVGAAGGAAAGGGVTATTVVVVGGAIAGGTVVATEVAGKSDDTPAPSPTPSASIFSDTFSGTTVTTLVSDLLINRTFATCTITNGNEIPGTFTFTTVERSVFGTIAPDTVRTGTFPVTLR